MTTNRAAKLLINQLNEQIDIIRKVRHEAELAFCVSYRTGNNEEATMRASMEADSAWDRHLRFIAATYGALYNVLNVEYMYVSQAEIDTAMGTSTELVVSEDLASSGGYLWLLRHTPTN